MKNLPTDRYLLTKLPFKEWDENVWKTTFSVESLAKGEASNIFFFVSAIGQAIGGIEESWKNVDEREDVLGFLDSCLIHSFRSMIMTEDEERGNILSVLCSFLMNYIETFRMSHNVQSSNVVVKIWKESMMR